MLMQKLLSKLPFGKRIIKKKAAVKFNSSLQYIKTLRVIVEEGVYTIKELVELKNILDELPIDLKVLQSIDKSTKVSFYSLSSQNALEAVRKKQYYRETIANSNIVDLFLTDLPLNGWWSGEESVNFFISFMRDMLVKSINLEQPNINCDQYNKGIGVVTGEEEEFINSLLYRLLLSDFLSLITLLMENINVETSE